MPLVLSPPGRLDERDDPLFGGGSMPPIDDGQDGFGGGGDDDDPGEGSWDPVGPPWVTLATFWHPAEAHILRLRLEASGVRCVLLDELTAATHVFAIAAGGVKLQVPQTQWRLASRLLHEHRRLSGPAAPGEPLRVRVAGFSRLDSAKAAACVVEARGLSCQVVEHQVPSLPPWSRLLPEAWRERLWPSASLLVERFDLTSAVDALRPTPFAASLTWTARRGHCDTCCADARWATWQLRWAVEPVPTRRALLSRLPRFQRRCGRCGQPWG